MQLYIDPINEKLDHINLTKNFIREKSIKVNKMKKKVIVEIKRNKNVKLVILKK